MRETAKSAVTATSGGVATRTDVSTARETFRAVQRHLSPALALAGKLAGQGAVEVRGDGARVTLSDGRTVLDFGSYAVTLLGHRHPQVVRAVRRQLDDLPVSTRTLVNAVAPRAAEALVEYLGGALRRAYFGLNGADAVEAAVKLARLVTGRPRVLAVEGGYHGKSMGALALTHQHRFRAGLTDLLTGATHVSPADRTAVAREVARGDVAALIFEPVQGENGVRTLDVDVVRQWCVDARSAGAVVIADEIQCGLRRCLARSVAQQAALPVDAVLLGKPLGGGVVPVSALLCTEELYAPLLADPFRHTTTFGGQPLTMAAVPAALDAIENLVASGERIADQVGAGLREIGRRHRDAVADVRGRGLLWGVDLTGAALAGEVLMGLAERGLVVSPCLSRPETIRLLPPLVSSAADVDEALSIVDESIGAASQMTGGTGWQGRQ